MTIGTLDKNIFKSNTEIKITFLSLINRYFNLSFQESLFIHLDNMHRHVHVI